MKKLLILISLLALLTSCSTPSPKKETKTPTSELSKQVYGLAVQGDVLSAIKKLKSVPESQLSVEEKLLKQKYIVRFEKNKKAEISVTDPFVRDVVSTYHDYWNKALMKTKAPGILRKGLFKGLKVVAKKHFNSKFGKYSEKEARSLITLMKEKLKDRGYHGIYGNTAPHLELMLWKTHIEKTYDVQFHDGSEKVKVVLLDDFLTKGWGDYATFGYSGTGGWAQKDKLFCVASSYDQNSEKYKVSYLAHEGRHFSDYKDFPKLQQPELEYRAKLTELTLSEKTTISLIDKFRTGANNDRKYPHAFANYWVYEAMKGKLFGKNKTNWQDLSNAEIQKAAVELLNENTSSLNKKGSEKVETIL